MANGKQNMWKFLTGFVNFPQLPKLGELYDHFKRLAAPSSTDCFNDEYGQMETELINNLESPITSCEWEIGTLNSNFPIEEIEAAVDYLQCTKYLGTDDITGEFIKSCKSEIANGLKVFNDIIEKRDFSERWTEGIRSVVRKGGPQISVCNFRESLYCHLWKRHSKA